MDFLTKMNQRKSPYNFTKRLEKFRKHMNENFSYKVFQNQRKKAYKKPLWMLLWSYFCLSQKVFCL